MEDTAVPEPLVPADVDLTDFKFMPLEVARLFDSEIMALEDAEAFRAGVASWCKGWHQVPAASLPNDNASLCKMLGYGRDAKTWAKLRIAGALRGWVLCSDGRLYHPIVAEKALEAWLAKLAQQLSSGAGNAKRWGIELDTRQINERIEIARRYLTALNPDSKALTKRKPPGVQKAVPAAVPQDVQSGDESAFPSDIPPDVPQTDGRQSQRDTRRDVDQDSQQDRNRQGQGQGQGEKGTRVVESSVGGGSAREVEADQTTTDFVRDFGSKMTDDVFTLIEASIESRFGVARGERSAWDAKVIRGWLAAAEAAGLLPVDALDLIGGVADDQLKKLAAKPKQAAPFSLGMLDKDVFGAIDAASRKPPKVADAPPAATEDRAPAPYDKRFTLVQWVSWIKPCTVTVADGRAVIIAPAPLTADRLRQHHDQDLRDCLRVDEIEIQVAPRVKTAKSGGSKSATVIQHPAMAGGSK